MSRLRLQYSKDEIITDLYTMGKELMYEDNIEYIGPYHRYTTGEIYTRPVWDNSQSKKLIQYQDTTLPSYRYKQLKYDIQTKYNSFSHHILELKAEDYDKGYVIRYFIKKINDNSIVEISKLTYDDYIGNLIDQNLYSVIDIKWQFVGPILTTYNQGITIRGVVDINQRALRAAEQKLPGISIKLNNLLEFYTDTDFTVPTDIN